VEEAVKCDESDNTTAILITFKPLEQVGSRGPLSLSPSLPVSIALSPSSRSAPPGPRAPLDWIRPSSEHSRDLNRRLAFCVMERYGEGAAKNRAS
jgi:hypothetical protein